jgi:putative protease
VQIGTVVEGRGDRVLVEMTADHRQSESLDSVIKPGDGVVFDEGHPEQDEQGGRVKSVFRSPNGVGHLELSFHPGSVNLAAVTSGSLVWKTDDPAFRRRIEQTFARDCVPRRVPVTVRLEGKIGGPLTVSLLDGSHEATVEWPGPLEPARRHALNAELVREQLGRLGETPFELGLVELSVVEPVMVPKSVLNDLRRRAVDRLMEARAADLRSRRVRPTALDELRCEILAPADEADSTSPRLYVLVRTREQLDAVCDWSADDDGERSSVAAMLRRPAMVYCDFEDVRRYGDSVAAAHASGLNVGLATLRIIKPGEEGLLAKIAAAQADAVLVRNLTALSWFREHAPMTALVGDFSLNVANELTADLFFREGLRRLVPSYDLNWEQLVAMLGRIAPARLEAVIHQHIPMFHMEHCVFAATLSEGKDWRDCGRPCDRHRVELRDRVGAEFPLLADTGCRNTVYNSVAQSAAEYVPRMLKLGLRHFRVELLREDAPQTRSLLNRYCRVLAGLDDGKSAWRGLQVLNQLGVTRGTLSG